MKINKEILQKALETVKPGLSNKEMIEQSTSFCFLNGRVITYNDEISISMPISELELEGAVNANEFYSFVNKVQVEELDLEVVENELICRAGKSKAGLILQSEIKLPISEIGEITKWKALPMQFLKAISFTMGATSRDMSRPILTCVHINKETIEAADNYRLAIYTLEKPIPISEFLLPANSCGNVLKFQPTEIAEGKGWVHFKNKDKAVLSCRIFEEKYVNLKSIAAIEGEDLIFPKELSTILDRAGIFSKRDSILDETVTITLESGKLQVQSTSASGWFTEKAKTEYKGESLEFKITPYLLKDIISEKNTCKISNKRLMFEGDGWIYITMLKS